ncbi:hypothetical protein FJZ17_03895 [Candidatus Pacearchaeota archaeon]|nr:hypothetical protein [Candidatus Pacearchaeota archaeon]
MRKILKNKKGCSRQYFEIAKLKIPKSKRSFDMPFSWIFAIIAGSIIIFIAIYATTRFINVAQKAENSESALELLNYLNPVVNGVMSSYATKFNFNKETRVYFNCSESSSQSPIFGRQTLAFSQISGFLKKWPKPGEAVPRYNKYIFAENMLQGKDFYIFSKPFYTGFRVDDIITISSSKYCLIAPPNVIEEEFQRLGLGNINVTPTITLCPKNTIKVCFGADFAGCNMSVYGECNSFDCESEFDNGYVLKKSKRLYYTGNLLYGAIFSSPEIYECNTKRIGKKVNELATIYNEKIDIVKLKDCDSIISPFLLQIATISKNLKSSLEIKELYQLSKDMDEENCDSNCRVYSSEKC